MNPRKFNLQQCYDMPDQSTGKKLREFPYSRSVSIDRYSESAPDETTISMFSQSLEQHKLDEKVQGDGIKCLGSGMDLRRGSIVDATIIRSEASTEREPVFPLTGERFEEQPVEAQDRVVAQGNFCGRRTSSSSPSRSSSSATPADRRSSWTH